MKRTALRRCLVVLLALVFLGSAGMLLYSRIQYREGDSAYAEAEELVELPDLTQLPEEPEAELAPEQSQEELPQEPSGEPVYVDPYADALQNMDFAALQEVNSDVLGWILIPDTQISYPLLQGTDNEYYLSHTWKKSSSAVGSIFLECRSSSGFGDFNTIVYGHRMNNGSMFASLKYYSKQSYWEAHPRVYIMSAAGIYLYDIFSAYEAGVTEDTYRLSFADDEEKQAFLDFCVSQSVLRTGIVPTVEDHILTLSTCTGRGHETRWVVQAVRVDSSSNS